MCKRTVIAPEYPQAGLMMGVETCYLTLEGLQLYPALRGEKVFSARIPVQFTPAVPAAASADEMDILRQMSFENEPNWRSCHPAFHPIILRQT